MTGVQTCALPIYTFLGLGVTGDGNNRTGWSDEHFDALLRRSAVELDPATRLATLAEAESLLLADGPFLPIYHYSTNELIKPYVHGIYHTALDIHPLSYVWIDHDWRRDRPPVAAHVPSAAASPAHAGARDPR